MYLRSVKIQLYATDWQLKNAYTNYKIDKPFKQVLFQHDYSCKENR